MRTPFCDLPSAKSSFFYQARLALAVVLWLAFPTRTLQAVLLKRILAIICGLRCYVRTEHVPGLSEAMYIGGSPSIKGSRSRPGDNRQS